MSFADLALHPLVLKSLDIAGYTEPTPVQAAAIPPAIEGRDILATAETGTGKTAAFVIPALQRLATPIIPRPRGPRVLILTPTRELASQVTKSARTYGKFLHLNIIEIVGGMPYRLQLQLMSKPLDIVIATPGRLIDHLERGRLDLSGVELLILDEADRMLDMGFIEPVEMIADACPPTRQTMLFTATMERRVAKIAGRILKDPVRIDVARTESKPDIEQRLIQADDLGHKQRLLQHFASTSELVKGIVFAATKRDADMLAEQLTTAGHSAAALHGDMDQRQRNRTLDRLRSGSIRLLVATDVAARGLDVRDITHVINFDLPRSAENYVHRIGRTGRAGATGIAISFATRLDRGIVQGIERYTSTVIPVHVVPGLESRRPFQREVETRTKRPFNNGPKRFGAPSGRRPDAARADVPRADHARPEFQRAEAPRSDRPRADNGRNEGGQAPVGRRSGERFRRPA